MPSANLLVKAGGNNPAGKEDQVRLIKIFGLAAITAVAAMAFIGASSATAGTTALCTANETPCADLNLASTVHLESVGSTVLLSSVTVLCLKSLAQGNVEVNATTGKRLAASNLGVKLTALTWEKCGTNAAHDNCTVSNLGELALFDVLRTVAGLGTANALALNQTHVRVLVNCSGLHCIYGSPNVTGFTVESAGHNGAAHKGLFKAKGLTVPELSGFLCPNHSLWDALYESLTNLYITT
jgi:hypothetical protein